MSWAVGTDPRRPDRDIGYGVPAYCDHPDCREEIDRGVAFVCGSVNTEGEDRGCGLHFCAGHFRLSVKFGRLCFRCWPRADRPPYEAKPAHPAWALHKLADESWAPWRSEHPDEVEALRAIVEATAGAAHG